MSSGCKRCVFSKASQSKCSCGADYMASTAVNFHSNSQGTRPQRQKLGNVAAAFAAKLAETQLSSSKPSAGVDLTVKAAASVSALAKLAERNLPCSEDVTTKREQPSRLSKPSNKIEPRAIEQVDDAMAAQNKPSQSVDYAVTPSVHLHLLAEAVSDTALVQQEQEEQQQQQQQYHEEQEEREEEAEEVIGQEQEEQKKVREEDIRRGMPFSIHEFKTNFANSQSRSIVSFGPSGNLVLVDSEWKQQSERSCAAQNAIGENIARSVSFLGSTQAGKSTILNALLGEENNLKAKTATDIHTSTTSGLQAYDCIFPARANLARRGAILVDVEGEDGTKPAEDSLCLLSLSARRAAVKRHFARLSYCMSNVVIFVSLESFANYTFLTRTLALARAATNGSEQAGKPILILISNKCDAPGIERPVDHLLATKAFMSSLKVKESFCDPAKLSPFQKLTQCYSEVLCFQMPHFGMDAGGKSGEVIFAEKINILKEILRKRLSAQEEQRPDMCSPCSWWKRVKTLVEQA